MTYFRTFCLLLFCSLWIEPLAANNCIECHSKVSPQLVSDWKMSKHSESGVSCDVCHVVGRHTSAEQIDGSKIPTPETCATCHLDQVQQFKAGKHAMAWAAMKVMPTAHWQPMALTEGMKGCGGCHKIGIKTDEEIRALQKDSPGFGIASCDACHTRHLFSKTEAQQPQACQTCHMGFDHPQWEMYSASKHGVRYLLKQNGILPEVVAAPKCQTCHMQEGNHEVRTAWGFLAVRLPMPEDEQWTRDRTSILQALGVLDLDGNPTARLEIVKTAGVARLTQEVWQQERNKMLNTCKQCHAESFAKRELEKGDEMIKQADHLMAEAIRLVSGLYTDGIISRPDNYRYAFPDLLTFHDAPTVIEQKLFVMFLEHRMRTFQGTFHANPDYSLWYGWSEMQRDLSEIRRLARELRDEHPAKPAAH